MTGTQTLTISGLGIGDESFSGEFGGRYSTYNVTRARRDCLKGKHGHPWEFDIAPALKATARVEVEPAKVVRFIEMPKVLTLPLIVVVDSGMVWLIDGHHRLRALHAIGATEFFAYAIEEHHRETYLVRFNGEERLPDVLSSWAGRKA